ncbi:MAG: hypothetical protein L6R30_01130 [Thermoanaerobaculia bacterium]|jgi:hypothetical protein|nr:hypothetical protein [Thermoanaerobaculia bacterium]
MVSRQQNPASRIQVPPETAGGGNRGPWIFRGAALTLVVLLLGANVAPATCAAPWTRWLGSSASGIPGDCCGGVVRPAGTPGDTLSDGSEGCCCPPGAPCSVTRNPGGPEAAPPEGASRAGVSESPGRDVGQNLGSARQNPGTPARRQAGDDPLFLRIGVLRI